MLNTRNVLVKFANVALFFFTFFPSFLIVFLAMNNSSLLSTVQNTAKGVFVPITWERDCHTRKGVTVNVRKRTSGVVRVGIDYDNVRDVRDGRENGTLPAENNGLPWGQWEVFPLSILHKECRYFRFYFATGADGKRDRLHVSYFLDGKPIEKEVLKEMGICLAKEFPDEKPDEEMNTFTVKEADIVAFGEWRKG